MNRSKWTLILLLNALFTTAITGALNAQQPKVVDAHRWYLLAVKALQHEAPMMERTYYTIAFAKHPHYQRIRELLQQPPIRKTVDDTSFAGYCNALAWTMITHPTVDGEDYENAKAIVLLGTQIGGVTWYSADTIATTYALSEDYDEAYKWAMTCAALYQLRDDHSEATLNTIKEKVAGIAEMIADRDRNVAWDERSLRKYLQLPSHAWNRYESYTFNNSDGAYKSDHGYVLSANPFTQTAWFKTDDGELIRLRKSKFDSSSQAEEQYTNCVKAFVDWDSKQETIIESLKGMHQQFVLDTDQFRALLRSGFRDNPELRPNSIREVTSGAGTAWRIDDDIVKKATSTVERSSTKWSDDLSRLVEGTKVGLGASSR